MVNIGMLHLVLYERKDGRTGQLIFVCDQRTFDKWEDADIVAKMISQSNNCRAWVAAIERPSRVELVKK